MQIEAKRNKKIFIIILILATLFKLSIFIFGALRVPDSIFDSDSHSYLEPAEVMAQEGVFGIRDIDDTIVYENFRTPGYPAFLAIFHNRLNLSLAWIVFLQLLITVIFGIVVYKIATEINPKIALLSMAIALFDPPTAVYSLKIMAEALFLIPLSLFLLTFIRYLKSGKINSLVVSAILLVISAYIRPVSYYLGVAVAVFIVYANNKHSFKRVIIHAILFLAITFAGLGLWQARNYIRTQDSSFAGVVNANFNNHSLSVAVEKERDETLLAKGLDYLGTASGSFMNLMTLPGSLKYYNSKSMARFGKVIFYTWMVFWMAGFIAGVFKLKGNIYLQFLLWVIVYFSVVTVINVSDAAGERLRIPMVPCLAVISAYGWMYIRGFLARIKNEKNTCSSH